VSPVKESIDELVALHKKLEVDIDKLKRQLDELKALHGSQAELINQAVSAI